MSIVVTIPGHLPSAGNMREHWRARAKRARDQRLMGRAAADEAHAPARFLSTPKVFVQFVRVAPRPLDDDNLAFAFKSVRDGVADAFGVADNDPRFSWGYSQERGKPPSLRIEFRA